MSYARQLLDSHPRTSGLDAGVLAAAIDALTDCAQACTADVDADLGEQDLAEIVHPAVPGLRRCLHRHCRGRKPPRGVRRQRGPAAARGLRGHLRELR